MESVRVPAVGVLVYLAVFEAVMGSAYGGSAAWVDRAQLDAILAPMHVLPGPAWNWPSGGSRFHAGPGLLAFEGPNPQDGETPPTAGHFSVFVAAHDPQHVRYLTTVPGVDWDSLSL